MYESANRYHETERELFAMQKGLEKKVGWEK